MPERLHDRTRHHLHYTCPSIAGPVIALRQRRLHENARLRNYVLSTAAAYQAYNEGALDRMVQLLEASIPGAREEDYRGFEWHHLWNRYRRELEGPALVYPANVLDAAYSPDGKLIAAACADGVIRVSDAQVLNHLREWAAHDGKVNALAYSADGRLLASGSQDQTVKLWDASTYQQVATLTADDQVNCLEFTLDGTTLIVCDRGGRVYLWDTTNAESVGLRTTIRAHEHGIGDISVCRYGSRFATASADKTVKVWRLPGCELERSLDDYTMFALSVAFSPDGRSLALRTLVGHAGQSWSVALSDDGSRVAASPLLGRLAFEQGVQGVIDIWDVRTRQLIHTISDFGAIGLIFSDDGRTLIAGGGTGGAARSVFTTSGGDRCWPHCP